MISKGVFTTAALGTWLLSLTVAVRAVATPALPDILNVPFVISGLPDWNFDAGSRSLQPV